MRTNGDSLNGVTKTFCMCAVVMDRYSLYTQLSRYIRFYFSQLDKEQT